MSIRHARDFWSGIFFILSGAFFMWFAREHDLGTASRMGPAYFPTLLSGLMALLGAVVALRGFLPVRSTSGETGEIEPFQWRIVALILGSVLLFSLILASCGLMASLAAMVAVAAFADKTSRVRETVVLIIVLDVLAYAIFVYGIGMLIPVWPDLSFATA